MNGCTIDKLVMSERHDNHTKLDQTWITHANATKEVVMRVLGNTFLSRKDPRSRGRDVFYKVEDDSANLDYDTRCSDGTIVVYADSLCTRLASRKQAKNKQHKITLQNIISQDKTTSKDNLKLSKNIETNEICLFMSSSVHAISSWKWDMWDNNLHTHRSLRSFKIS